MNPIATKTYIEWNCEIAWVFYIAPNIKCALTGMKCDVQSNSFNISSVANILFLYMDSESILTHNYTNYNYILGAREFSDINCKTS